MKKTPLNLFLAPKYWPTWIGLFILRLFSVLPLPLLAIFGWVIGLLFYYLGASRRRVAYKNISVCFPELSEQQCQKINREHYVLVGQSLFTVPMNWWISKKRFNKFITVSGREAYDAALTANKNIILLAPHFASLDVAGLRLAQERPMLTMYQYAKNGLVDEIVKRGRLRYGGVLVERKEPLRNLIRAIRKGYPFYYLPDQDAGRKGIFVPFFHEQAATYSMLGKFAEMTDAVVIPCRTKVKSWGQGYEVILGEALSNFPSGDDVQDTTRMNQEVAELIKPNPEQYFWVHKRFKTRPPTEQKQGVKFYK